LRSGKFNNIAGFYFLGPLTIRTMVDVGIFVGHKIRLFIGVITPNHRCGRNRVGGSELMVAAVAWGLKKQIDQSLNGTGLNIVGHPAPVAEKRKR
jgi:hypothetical protein